MYLALIVATAVVCSFLFGYDSGVVSGATLVLRRDFVNFRDKQESILVSITEGSAAIASLVGISTNHYFGRKPTIAISSFLYLTSSVIMASAPQYADRTVSFATLVPGRLIVGAAIGLSSMTVPPYIAEVAPTRIRGTLLTVVQVMITSGFAFANLASSALSYVGAASWRYMLGLGAIPALLQIVAVWFLPESPRWLWQTGKCRQANDIARRLGLDYSLTGEQKSMNRSETHTSLLMRVLRSRSVHKALVIGAGLQFVQQLCGINAVMYYAASILKMAGIQSNQEAMWWSALIAFVHLLATLPGLYLVEKLGRRPLLLCSMAEHCGFCYDAHSSNMSGTCYPLNTSTTVGTGPCSGSNQLTLDVGFCPSAFVWLPILGMTLYLCSFSLGFGSVVWTINAEIYPQWARAFGNAVATFTNWSMDLVVGYSFLPLSNAISREGLFFLFAGITVIGTVFTYMFVPETKGRSLESVERTITSSGGYEDIR